MAGLVGTWASWMSDGLMGSSPSARFTQVSIPYRLLDDTPVADGWAGLTSGTLAHAIDMDENKAVVPTSDVWTATTPAGAYAGNSCNNWMPAIPNTMGAVVGLTSATDGTWTDAHSDLCTTSARVYCFQQ